MPTSTLIKTLLLVTGIAALTACQQKFDKLTILRIKDVEPGIFSASASMHVVDMDDPENYRRYGFILLPKNHPGSRDTLYYAYDQKIDYGDFKAEIKDLYPDADYSIKAFLEKKDGSKIMTEKNLDFHTKSASAGLPYVRIVDVASIQSHAATLELWLQDQGTGELTDAGLCWDTAPQTSLADAHKSTGSFPLKKLHEVTLEGLEQGRTYYVRAYAQNNRGIAYSNEITLTPKK